MRQRKLRRRATKHGLRRKLSRVLGGERLEDRRLLATFVEAGAVLNLQLQANENVGIVANANTYSLTITGGTGNWSGTNSANVTGNATNVLTVTTAGQGVFNTIDITDAAANTSATFNDSGVNDYTDAFNVTLSNAGAGNITFAGNSNFDTASGTLTAQTTAAITVNIGATVTQASGALSLAAGTSVTAPGGDDGIADLTAPTISLVAGGAGTIGTSAANRVEVDAATLNATTAGNNIWLADTAGGVALGTLDAGSAMILLDVNGAITDGNGPAVNLTAGNGVNLTTIDLNSAIGTVGDPIETAIGSLSATTNDGGIFISDSNGPGLIVNTVLAKQGGNAPIIGAGGQIVLELAGTSGTHDVSITAQGPIVLNSVVAPDAATVSSVNGVIVDMNQEPVDIRAQSVTLTANGDIGQGTDPIELTVESFSASTTNGDIFLTQGIVGTAASVVAGGANNDVVVTTTAESLRLGVITAQGNVTMRNSFGSFLDANGATNNITGNIVDLTGATGVGTVGDPLETQAVQLIATVTDSAAPIRINQLTPLLSVAAKTNAGDVMITFPGGPLQFTASTQVLNASGAAATFENTGGDVKLGVVDAVAGDVSITASGAITDDTNDGVLDLRGGTVTLQAGTGIGTLGNEIDTDVATLSATTTSGGIFIREANALSLSASTLGTDIDVRTTTGDMTLGPVSAPGQVTLHAGGAILDGNGDTNNVSADTLDLLASNGIGTGGNALETSVNSLTASGGAGGGLFLANNKTLTLTSASATGGDVSIAASGNLTLASALTATGQNVVLSAIGELIDMNPGNDITANSATLNASKIGVSGDKFETNLAALTAATTAGGIFVSNTGASLALVATALGQAAHIDIDTTGDIVLDTATAQGDTVKLRAGGAITDGNDPPPPDKVNITAKGLDVAAPGGIGTSANPLEADVDQVITLDGGAGGANLRNTGPLLLTETALQSAGTGTLTFDAESITIENIGDDTATLALGRSLELRTQTGDIVFLDSADTIESSGAGTITIEAGVITGSGAVAVLGNLKTAGGDIMVTADKHITIGQLDAGSGDVTVQARAGIILDGNGATINVIGGTTTLIGAAPTAREAELHEEFKIAEAAAASAEAAAKETSAEAFGSGSEIVAAATIQAQAAVNSAVTVVDAKQAIYDPLNQKATDLEIAIEVASGIAFGLDITSTIAETVAAVAEGIPLTGDLGAAAVASVVIIASKAADATVLGLSIAKDKADTEKGNAGTELTEAKAELAAARSTLTLATQTRNAFQESFSIADAAAVKAGIIRDASARVRDQAVLARDQANVIGTFTAPLGLQITGVINVTAGPTDSYLQVVGDTAVDLIQATGSVTLISTGVISDADAGGGADITGLGLRTIAVGGIGTAADPLETRVDTLNASNTTGGDIAISNTVGTPAALNITGISNAGGGDVIVSNQGVTAAGQGITVSGPISATGAGAAVTINSGSPLTVAADVIAPGSVTLTAAETAGPGDDLTVNAGVTIESTGAFALLRAGDNVNVATGATIKAATSITITANFTDDAGDATGAEVVVAGELVAPSALINVDPTADDDDTFTITPSVATPITVDAEDGTDTLNFVADGLAVTILDNTITAAGRAPVTFNNFEFVNITNVGGDGSVTLLTAPGDADVMILTGTGQGAGTFTLNGGIPISFSGTTSFTFNAGDMNDSIVVSPFATSVLPWNVAVTIDGGADTDRITYNNVVGLFDNTIVTATGPGSGHIDSPGVTSALNSQLVSFTNIEDITANANPGEDEKLTVNHRDTSAADTTTLIFDPTPGADDLQLAGLFDMVIDTDNYVGLTINGRGGDDTFNVTPGPIPVRINGGDPVGSTAGDLINFTPAGVFIIEPGPENDEGGFNAVGSERVSWDHIEEVSVTGGGPSVFLGTNGDDDITIIARDSSTHAAADGVQDFTVSLNNGPSILYLDAPVFFVDSLGGDDDVVVREAAPNAAAWNVQLFVAQGTPGLPTGDQGDVFSLETPGTQSVAFTPNPAAFTIPTLPAGVTLTIPSPSGVDTAIVNDATNTSAISLTPFNLSVPLSNFEFTSSPGGADTILYNGLGGGDTLTINGTAIDDTFIVNPSNGGSGSFRSNLSPTFDFTGADAITATGGSGGSDEVIVDGTNNNDVIVASAATRMVTVTDSTGTTLNPVILGAGIEIATIQAKQGDDLILAIPDPVGGGGLNSRLHINVNGGLPGASDTLIVASDALGSALPATDFALVALGLSPGEGRVRVFRSSVAMPDISYTGVELVRANVASDVDGNPQRLIFGPDPNEPNDARTEAVHLGGGQSLNADNLSIFGATSESFPTALQIADTDWYQFVAAETGTLDFQVFFEQFAPALLPGGGDLDISVSDSDGTVIINGTDMLDAAGNVIGERIAIGAVRNETYFLSVRSGSASLEAVNAYELSVINVPLPVSHVIDLQADSDSGRSDTDDITNVTTPTIDIFLDDDRIDEFTNQDLLPDSTDNNTQDAAFDYGVEVFNNGSSIGFAFLADATNNRWQFTAVDGDLNEGHNNFLTTRTWIRDQADPSVTGVGELGPINALQITLDTIAPPVSIAGLNAPSDTGVEGSPDTFSDNITSDTAPGFYGSAEADAIVRLYVDSVNDATIGNPAEFALTVASPHDGDEAFFDGKWLTSFPRDLNDPDAPGSFPFDGLREVIVEAEDIAGNINTVVDAVGDGDQQLEIFIDTQGPQVTSVEITGNPAFDLFDVKPSQGPTPLVNSISIGVQDLPNRVVEFLYDALQENADGNPAENLGHYEVVGDHNGLIVIESVQFNPDVPVPGSPATGTIIINFADPLPDDRFTLTIADAIVDPAGNALDGETNASQPNGGPGFPSGDGVPGGNFTARFTVDTRAEIGVWAAGSVYIDTNGNNSFDPEGDDGDQTNADIVYKLGFQTDYTFAGNFAAAPGDVADGFSKLGAYGQVAGQFRWLIDTNNNGVPDLVITDPAQINGRPVAGHFDGNAANGDEVALKDGVIWYLDTNHDFWVDTTLAGDMIGLPIVGDFDGDGLDDLGAWADDVFSLDLSGVDGIIDGFTDVQFTFGFPGVREIPVAADFNGDGIDDLGLWNPDAAGVAPGEQSEWMILVSKPSTSTLLGQASFNTAEQLSTAAPLGIFVADDFVPVDVSQTYQLSGEARSGNIAGNQYQANNRQYFGFASYDSDQLQIAPIHVSKFGTATDTQLAVALNPGDTEIVLQDATGWANAGAAHQRSLAWYGYTNGDGFTYPDYTYTRNVASNFATGLWGAGGIAGNVITLSSPWTGPSIPAGMAVRNAVSGGTYNYAALSGQAVPQPWTEYSATLSGTGLGPTQFRPGTAFIKPVVLTNYVGGSTNLINWRNIEVHLSTPAAPITDRIVPDPQGILGNVIDFTPEPFGEDLFASFGDASALPVVGNFDPPVVPVSGAVDSVQVVGLNGTNADNAFDVDGNGLIEPHDVLLVVNHLNRHGVGAYAAGLKIEASGQQWNDGPLPDVDGDGMIDPYDALRVVNRLNRMARERAAQGESQVAASGSSDATARDAVFASWNGDAAWTPPRSLSEDQDDEDARLELFANLAAEL